MDYVPSYDQLGTTPLPPAWLNANPSAGVQGAIPNATFFNYVQAELLAIQDEAAFTRDGTNLKQVMHAIRSGKLMSFADTGTADALIVTPITAYAAIALGTEITVLKGAAANATTAPTLSLGTFTHPIAKEDGTPLAAGDLPAHALITVKYDGSSAYRVVGLRKSDASAPSIALWHVGLDTSQSAAAIVTTVSPAVSSRLVDAPYLIIPANTCAGATTMNVGFGNVSLTRSDGSALQSGDYAAGQPLVIVDDGTVFRVVSLTQQQVYNLSPGGLRRVAASAGLQQQSDIAVTPSYTAVLSTGSFTGASFAECGGACALRNTTGTASGGTVRFALVDETTSTIVTSPYVGGGTSSNGAQIAFTVPAYVFAGMNRAHTYHISIYAQRGSSDGVQSTWDPSIFVQHDGN